MDNWCKREALSSWVHLHLLCILKPSLNHRRGTENTRMRINPTFRVRCHLNADTCNAFSGDHSLKKRLFSKFHCCLHYFSCKGEKHVQQRAHGGQRSTFRSQFSAAIIWVSGLNLGGAASRRNLTH